jgi:ABC-type transporter Mla subunit MlaD
MRSRSGIGRKRRQFNRNYDVFIIVGLMILLTVVVVGFLIYMLTSPNWRMRS